VSGVFGRFGSAGKEVKVALECEVVDVELQQSMNVGGWLAARWRKTETGSAACVISCDAQRKRLVQAAANRVAPRMLTSYQRWNGGINRIGPKEPC
jgi:hypothetical protein